MIGLSKITVDTNNNSNNTGIKNNNTKIKYNNNNIINITTI